MFLDDTACNLASLNLMKFVHPDGRFDVEAFRHAVGITLLAQEIVVDSASYPTARIGENSFAFRPLGLGYANLGAMLMSLGLPYDSEAGRAAAAAVTALMCGEAYATSARCARDHGGPFAAFPQNRAPMLEVIARHRLHAEALPEDLAPRAILTAARDAWRQAEELGAQHGIRNSQVTVLAPTGTIAFMMDCDTTGIEPDIALVKYKKLVGGGLIKIVNNTVPVSLRRLNYSIDQIQEILDHIEANGTIEGAPHLREEHVPVFDCAFRAPNGSRSIAWMGHLKMMAAAQPFLSGAISKTVNLPEDATVEDVEKAYIEAWRMGLKAVAIYRDGCKRTQPLTTSSGTGDAQEKITAVEYRPMRRRLPDERPAVTHKFSVAGHEGYITVGLYPETRQPGEIFVADGQAGLGRLRADGRVRHGDLAGAAVRGAAQGAGRQVQSHALRAGGLHQQQGDPDREIDRGLHLPLAGAAVPARAGGREGRDQGCGRDGRERLRRHRRRGGCARRRAGDGGGEPGEGGLPRLVRCAAVLRVRPDHGAQRGLLRLHQLRFDLGLLLTPARFSILAGLSSRRPPGEGAAGAPAAPSLFGRPRSTAFGFMTNPSGGVPKPGTASSISA